MTQEATHKAMETKRFDQVRAVALLQGLVAIPSLSRHEQAASEWLVTQMRELGFGRAYVDTAGNAVGELGLVDAPDVIMLLGHIDTVPGAIPVRIDESDAGPTLYGRGSVDAKGPLATFVAAAARIGNGWAEEHDVRVVVVGAVEEEAATSKGAREIRKRFDGVQNPVPAVCVIGEPSGWTRITLGYKGRLLVELRATQPMMHTAGPDMGVATVATDLWQWVARHAEEYNRERPRTFDQLLPSLRRVQTETTTHMDDAVEATIGIRLPPDFDTDAFAEEMLTWLNARVQGNGAWPGAVPEAGELSATSVGNPATVTLTLRGYERTWRSET